MALAGLVQRATQRAAAVRPRASLTPRAVRAALCTRTDPPELVLEEERTGLPPGLPIARESEVWANPEMLLPEKAHLWWDDGTAEPEWYVDRTWPVSDGRAVRELALMLTFLLGGGGLLATFIGDKLRPAAPRQECMPYDLRREHGFPDAAEGGEEEEEEDDDDDDDE
eukprot:CAMPEP_0119352192 /NCGR_PEP_ID=MMETSP1334-20130426/1508_1 /TAXON_ID=127549 /ORGANISM="Calcidiscus leptoporus, Strain RCC1130" /LENGTH=167 /DNA_ID=CAMNT_0007365183 /DNA_START=31 /DNA_END=534 /DNA_ORIENTATION=+